MGKEIYVGLVGFGTIGSGLVKLLQDNSDLIEQRLGARLVIKKIADLDITTPRKVSVASDLLTTDIKEILDDPDISIVVELMGGYEHARSFIVNAMRRKKHVVTANKALLAMYGNELFTVADEEQVNVGFEASVGGTIPIIKTLRESLVGNNIISIFAIMNGTSNYILTKMSEENRPFDEVLKEAQRLGFAEADPTYDIEGIDTAHKLALTLALSYGKRVNMEELYREGISGISLQDIGFAKELGYKIKLLAIALQKEDGIEARIHPTMIPFDHLLSTVGGNYNAFHFFGDASGSVFLYGQGAGMMPTASSVVCDLVDITRDMMKNVVRRVPLRSIPEDKIDDMNLITMDEIVTSYYFRFSAYDRPGVLSKIAGILGNNNISIAAVIQKGREAMGLVPVVMTTHPSKERNVQKALKEIDKLDVVGDKTILFRIEDERLK
jgi:homoserine dehydrogenase